MTLLTSAAKVFLDRFAPDCTAFVEMHLRGIALLQSVDGLNKLFAATFIFDVLDWIQISLEGEDEGLRVWESMQSLALTPKESL